MNLRQLFPVLLGSVLLCSCSTQNLFRKSAIAGDTAAFAARPDYQYVIRKDDKINLSIWDHEDMSVGSVYGIYNSNEVYGKWLIVDAAGAITLPKLGAVSVAGKTVTEAEAALREQYKKWIVNPIIDLKVLNKEVTVLGELRSPGKYTLERDNNYLLDVIARAGDFDTYANKKKVRVVRKDAAGAPRMIAVDLTRSDSYFTQNVQLQPGDIIYVPARSGKGFEKRAGATLVPIATTVTAIVLLSSLLK